MGGAWKIMSHILTPIGPNQCTNARKSGKSQGKHALI